MMSARWLTAVPGVVLACVVTGCTSDGSGASRRLPSSGSRSATVDVGSPDRDIAPECRRGTTVAVGRSGLDASLGRRYLRLDVRNCTARPVSLLRPVVVAVAPGGAATELRVVPMSVAHRAEGRFVLVAGQTASAGISWRNESRPGEVSELRVSAAAGDRPAPLPLHPLELRPTSTLDYYPWVSQPGDAFSG